MGERDMKSCRLPEAWGDWQICGLAGEGACGSVYRAVNGKGEISAVKVMDVPAGAFEVEALMRLKGCPYIVEAEDYFIQETGEGRWKVFLRMEYLKSLTELLHERTLGEEEVLDMMIGLCGALEKCGQEQIIHRDIKPENILITKEGRAKLADFGIAGDPAETDRSRAIQGTFSYMAPEIFHGQRYDRTADIYSLGMVFYRIMNRGREPFVPVDKQIVGYKDREAALQERMDGAALPAPAAASPELARILQKACKFRPQQRYQSAAELRRALERCRRNRKNRLLRRMGGWSPGRHINSGGGRGSDRGLAAR